MVKGPNDVLGTNFQFIIWSKVQMMFWKQTSDLSFGIKAIMILYKLENIYNYTFCGATLISAHFRGSKELIAAITPKTYGGFLAFPPICTALVRKRKLGRQFTYTYPLLTKVGVSKFTL